jgi:predicted phage-related endonuclease
LSLSPEREGRLTASVFANAIGVGYDSRQKLWRQLTGREPRFEGNAATEWWKDNEIHAITAYEVATGDIVQSAGGKQGFVISASHDWLGCTPDGYVGSDIVVEAKCPASMQVYGKVPDHYMPQIQGQLFITGRKLGHFVCWTPEGFEVWEVPFDEEYWHVCIFALSEFYSCWKSDLEPPKRKKPILPTVEYRRLV